MFVNISLLYYYYYYSSTVLYLIFLLFSCSEQVFIKCMPKAMRVEHLHATIVYLKGMEERLTKPKRFKLLTQQGSLLPNLDQQP